MFILIIIINLCEVVDDSILIGFAGGHVSRGPTHEALVRAARDPVTDLATIFKLSNLSIYSMTHFVIESTYVARYLASVPTVIRVFIYSKMPSAKYSRVFI